MCTLGWRPLCLCFAFEDHMATSFKKMTPKRRISSAVRVLHSLSVLKVLLGQLNHTTTFPPHFKKLQIIHSTPLANSTPLKNRNLSGNTRQGRRPAAQRSKLRRSFLIEKQSLSRGSNRRAKKVNTNFTRGRKYVRRKGFAFKDRTEVTTKQVNRFMGSLLGDCCYLLLPDGVLMPKEPAVEGSEHSPRGIPGG